MLSATHFAVLKPIIPRRVQILLRRVLVHAVWSANKNIWPIDPSSLKPPQGWCGWPEGKKFALVLTHDVDTQYGYDHCGLIMNIEERLGFRSAFNFVAEDLNISGDLMQRLKEGGFEIGVHGVRHSNPFRSWPYFMNLAEKINRYLKEWDAVGFRSPSMYHNLEWLHALDIEYDASTFDTDPFEPQPDGMRTIFPFWVAGDDGRPGYVELPYTLPQDFLLYVLMRQTDIDIWKTKLDWIVQNGGMALFITHPDYIETNGASHYQRYPLAYYERFLRYIQSTYEGQYWHVLPRDMARFWRANYSWNKERIYAGRTDTPSMTAVGCS